MSLPVYSRASLSRTAATVVAPFLTATESAVAREFRAAGTQSEDYPTAEALRCVSRMIAERSVGGREIGEYSETIERIHAGAVNLWAIPPRRN